ncbi:MAG: hypothetical protein IPF52_10510 [Saprospiraceae bacterium]|nr:hypothetical protein [Saprospiraceae bacterium]
MIFFLTSISGLTAVDYTLLTTGDWNVTTNWSPNGVPGVGDKAIIPSGKTVTLVGDVTIDMVDLSGGTISGNFDLTISGTLVWTAGGFSGSGIVHVTGILNSSSNNVHTLGGSKELRISNVATFTSALMTMTGTAKILVLSGGSFIWTGTNSVNLTGTFSNIFEVQSGGTLTKNGTGGFNIIAQVNLLNCTTIVNTGTLTISAPGTIQPITNGSIQINTGSKLNLSRNSGSPVYNITGTAISGGGILEVSGTTVANFELGTNITLSGTLAVSTGAVSNIKSGCAVTMMPKILLSGGSINDEISINAGEVTFEVGGTYGGTGSPTFGNGFTWTAGGFSGSGIVHVTGILNSSSNNVHTLGGSKELRISNVATFTSALMTMTGTAKILVPVRWFIYMDGNQ